MSFAESLTDQERRRARIMAYASTWFGCISEVMIDSSAIIIIFMTMMQGSNMMTMMTTSISGICSMLLMIPCAAAIPFIGLKRAVKYACITGCFGYLLMASAPLFGPVLAKYVVLLGCFFYAVERPLYSATWYPLLDQFLRPQDRGDFFGFLRFSYMLLSGGLFFLVGLLMGDKPPVWLLQVVIGVTGLLVLGRWYFINQFPIDPNAKAEKMNIRKSLWISLTNGPLTGYSVYSCLFSLAYSSIYPLSLIYLKSGLHVPVNQVQIISTIGIAGSIAGFLCYGKLLRCFSLRFLELTVHFVMMIIAFALFFYGKDLPGFLYVISTLLFVLMFFNSVFLCNNSGEMMALARPGNKLMASSYCQTYTAMGNAIGRTASSFLIGSSMLAANWTTSSGTVVSRFQTLFLICGCLILILLVLLPLMPSVIPKHHDYYEPPKKADKK